MSTFNTVHITQLNNEINTLKEKTDLILDVVHLHEKHLHHLDEKFDQTNKLLADLLESNVWFSSKVTDAIEKKFQSVVWHHKNVVKSAQHHRLAPGALPHDVLDGIITHVTQMAQKKNLVPFVTFASDLFQIKVSHLYTPATNKFMLILHTPMVANSNLLNLYEFLPVPIHFNFASNISITPDVGPTNHLAIGHSQSFQMISSTDLHACLHLGDTFFCKGRKVMETSLKRSCLGALYMANSESTRITAISRFQRPEKRSLNSQKTLGPYTPWAQSTPMRSVQLPMKCKSNPEKQSGSNLDVMFAPWNTSSRPTNLRPSRSRSRPWTGPEKSRTSSIMGTKTR